MDINKLKLNENNPQNYGQKEIDKLGKSIQSFPKMLKLRPIVYDPATGKVLGGNKRLMALQKLGYKEVPDEWIQSADELTEDEKNRFLIQDNIQFGEWDEEMLAEWDQSLLEDWGLLEEQAEEAFSPDTNPDTDAPKPVDENDIKDAEESTKASVDNSSEEGDNVVCPNCYHEFKIRGKG